MGEERTHWRWPRARPPEAAARGPCSRSSSAGGGDGRRVASAPPWKRPGGGGAGRGGAESGAQVSGTPSPRPREVKKYFVAIFFRVCLLDLRFRGGPAFNRIFFFRFHFFFCRNGQRCA
jgi:hypothetical protein